MKTTLAAGAAAVFAPAEFGHAAETKLSWKHFPAGPTDSSAPRCCFPARPKPS